MEEEFVRIEKRLLANLLKKAYNDGFRSAQEILKNLPDPMLDEDVELISETITNALKLDSKK